MSDASSDSNPAATETKTGLGGQSPAKPAMSGQNSTRPESGGHGSGRNSPYPELSEQTKGMYAIGLAIVVGLAILLGTLWIANQNFNTALAQWPAGGAGAGSAAGANAGASGAGAGSNAGTQQNPPASLPTIDLSTRPFRGAANAPAVIFEIADFQCPYCQQAYPTVEQVMAKYNGSVRLIFIHFPLPQHPLAEKAAEASECANDQGKFFEYYDSLFTTRKLEVGDLKAQAQSLGLDTAKFNQCLDSGSKAPLIEAFSNLVVQNGISSTPTFIVNGQPLTDNSLAGFSKAIDAILNPPRAIINTANRPMRGNASAQLQVVEFSDFECPYCEREYGVMRQVENDYAGRVSFTYLNYPLTSIHPDAQKAAEAAECAYRQKPGAFWQFHDWMFENRSLDIPSLKAYAAQIGLNATRFNACLDGGEAAAQVAADAAQGSANGVQGTPAVFINGLEVKGGAQPYEVVKGYLDRELALLAKNSTNASAGAS